LANRADFLDEDCPNLILGTPYGTGGNLDERIPGKGMEI
jgi:hypothetical protein